MAVAFSQLLEAALRCHSVKEIARLAAVTPRTVERWRDQSREPSALTLLRLMAHSRRIRTLIAEQLSVEWLDAEEARLRAELADLQRKRQTLGPVAQAAVRAIDAAAATALGPTEAERRVAQAERSDPLDHPAGPAGRGDPALGGC